MQAEEFNFKLYWRHFCYCRHYLKKRPCCNSQTVLSSIHPAESACANAVHYLSFKDIMTHHPLFLLAPSKVIPSPASHSLIGIQRRQENLSHLLSQVLLKRYFTAVEHFIIYCTCPQCVAIQEDSTAKASVPCSRTLSIVSILERDKAIQCINTKTGQTLIRCKHQFSEHAVLYARFHF